MTAATRVLYVDDESDLLNIGKIFLEQSGDFTVTKALSAQEGIRLLEQEKYGVIISDYQMPGMNGIEFLIEVRKHFGSIPFILFTGRGREEVVIQAINSGADFYLQKGGEPEAQFAELTHKVKSAIKQYSSENSLQKSEAQFRAISENSQDFIMRYDKEHRHTYANPACLRAVGMTAEQFIGKTHHELGFPPDLCALWEPAIDKVFETGQPYRETFEWTGVDGQAILDWRLFPEKDDKGNVVSILGVSRDISTIKSVEKSLREAQKRTVTVLDDIADTFYSLDDKWRFVIVNPAAEKAPFGRPASELLGRVIWDIYPDLVGTFIQQHYFNAAKNFSLEHFEGPSPLNGRWYEVFMQGWRGGVDVHMRDITERKQAVDALQESHDRLIKSETDFQIQQTEIEMQAEELRRINLALEDSRDHYLDLYEFAPIGYFTLNDKALITGANLTGAKLLGVERSKLVKAPLSKFIAEKDADEWYHYFRNVLKHKEKQTCSLMLTRGDGSTFPVQLESIRITHSDATQTVRVAVSDFTERKWAEEALRETKDYLENLFTYANAPIIVWNPSFEITRFNHAFEELTGRPLKQVIGKRLEILFPPDSCDASMDLIQKALSGERWNIVEIPILVKDGSVRTVLWNSANILDPDGRIISTIAQGVDITVRRQAEDALREANGSLNNLFDYANAPIIVWDPNFVITRFNHAFEDLTLISEQEVIGQRLDILFPEESKERSLLQIKKTLEGERWETVEIPILVKDGGVRTVLWNSANILDPDGWIISTIAQGVDITDRKVAEGALIQANKKLTLLSGITRHDINNQLTGLRGYLTLLEEKQPDHSFTEYFQKINAAAQRISTMIQFTKEYDKIGVNSPVWQDCRILVDIAAKEAPLGKIVVKNDLPAGAEVFADPLVVKVCYNLMDNAVRYGGKITTIRFSVEEHDGDHVLVCEDDGEGVVAQEKEKIFERGFGKNTGLGLALSREILDITGITIKETGEPGKGARFEMTVPKGAWRMTGTGD